jgi:hypothetical protein
MKKFLLFLLLVGGIVAAVAIVMRRRSEDTFEDTWESFASYGTKAMDNAGVKSGRDPAA